MRVASFIDFGSVILSTVFDYTVWVHFADYLSAFQDGSFVDLDLDCFDLLTLGRFGFDVAGHFTGWFVFRGDLGFGCWLRGVG